MSNWRKLFSAQEDQKPGVYKNPEGKQIPNNAKFTGDKFPSQGNPVKKEQSAWQEGNRLQQQDSKKEISVKNNSPLMDEKTRRERFESLRSKSASRFFIRRASDSGNWRSMFLTKKADTSFKQKPDGTLQIDITTPRPGQPIQPGVQPGQEGVIAPQSAPAQPAAQPEPEKKAASLSKNAAERKAFYDNDPVFQAWFAEKSQDQEFINEFHLYMQRNELYTEDDPMVFEDWAYGKYQEEKQQTPTQVPQEAVTGSKEPDTWLIDTLGEYRLEGRECATHAGIRIMKGNEEIEFQKIAKQGHEWRELIPQAIWQSKLETYAAKK